MNQKMCIAVLFFTCCLVIANAHPTLGVLSFGSSYPRGGYGVSYGASPYRVGALGGYGGNPYAGGIAGYGSVDSGYNSNSFGSEYGSGGYGSTTYSRNPFRSGYSGYGGYGGYNNYGFGNGYGGYSDYSY